MFRGLLLFLALGTIPLPCSNVHLLTSLPNGAVSKSIQLDSAGNIYVAGFFVPTNEVGPNDFRNGFVAKVSADGSKVLYFTALGGSSDDIANAVAVGADGSAYVTGYTGSVDFPVTAGALQSTYGVSNPLGGPTTGAQTFLVKVDPAGKVVYSTFLGGSVSGQGTGIALDPTGAVLLTGGGGSGLPGTSGAVAGPLQGWVLKIDAGLSKVLLVINGYGSGLITLDKQANIYLAGIASAGAVFGLPALPAGGFQSTHAARFCQTTTGPSGFAVNCNYQYVAKLDPTGTKLLWATYVTGSYGAIAGGIAVDGAGNVLLAGTTNSDDYPVTPGAYQTAYTPAMAPPPFGGFPGATFAPPATGYITKLNATGTALLWSTYFGGSYADHITGMAVDASGDILISGRAGSNDLPALAGAPDGCRPTVNQVLGYVARVSSDGATAGPAQLVYGAPDCLYASCNTQPNYQTGWPVALRQDGTAVTAGVNGSVATVDFSASSSRLACVTDSADNAQLSTVAPGQVVAIFGTDLAAATPFVPPGGTTNSANGIGVTFNGVTAPILYTSAQQINVQVPFEIAGQSTVKVQVTGNQTALPLAESRTMGVVARQPAVLLTAAALLSPFPGYTVCGAIAAFGEAAVAANADGTLNDCTNPASAGSVVTIYFDGMGQVTPAQSTGVITPAPAVAITPAVSVNSGPLATAIATTTVPGVLTGVNQVKVQVPAGSTVTLVMTLLVGNTSMRENRILVWTRPN
jgi:uncharacterized protein (TIGR03437 family)